MEQPKITFIVNGETYRLRASDAKSIRDIPGADRQQLIALLEAIKLQDALSRATVQNAVDSVKISTTTPLSGPQNGGPLDHRAPKPERLGSGDIDALMTRLIMEEKRDKKPGLTSRGLVKWVVGLTGAIILLVLIF
jgi:hypothetical protein